MTNVVKITNEIYEEENQLNESFQNLHIEKSEIKTINQNQINAIEQVDKFPFIVIDDITIALNVLEMLNQQSEVTFDCEGVNLGRTGKLTVITISTLADDSIAYIFDIETLIHRNKFNDLLFNNSNKSLKTLLESVTTTKISFDCRTDSDALWHQLNIKLTNCVDLQVYNQGIERFKNKYKETYRGYKIHVPGLMTVSKNYLPQLELLDLTVEAPHKLDMKIWEKRPLPENKWRYAANDVHIIKLLYISMKKENIPESMIERIRVGSDNYLDKFRSHNENVNLSFKWYKYKYFILNADDI